MHIVLAATVAHTGNVLFLPLAVATVCGWVIPPLVDLVLKSTVPTPIKTIVATGLSAIAGAASTVVFAPGEKWQDYVLAIAAAVVNTQAGHRILQGLGDPVQQKFGNVGVGPAAPTPPQQKAA